MSSNAISARANENFSRESANRRAMIRGEDFDHVPINPMVMGYSAVAHGHTLHDFYTNPEQSMIWQLELAGQYGIMPNLNWNYAVYWCEDYGGTVKMPTGRMSAPGILTYPATTPEEVEKLEVLSPEEINNGPTMALHARGLRAMENIIGKKYKPWQFIYEPFAIGSFWTSPEMLLMWVYQDPDLVHALMRKVVEHEVNACQAVSDLYPGKPFMTMCSTLLANSSTMSVDQCKEFATDHMKGALERIVKIGGGSTGIFYHQCGDHADDYHLCADMPFPTGSTMHIAYEGLEPFDLMKAAKIYEDKCTLLGNVDTALAFRGRPERIYKAAREQAERYKHFKNGFIAGMACECPPFIPKENFEAFVRGSKDGGSMKD